MALAILHAHKLVRAVGHSEPGVAIQPRHRLGLVVHHLGLAIFGPDGSLLHSLDVVGKTTSDMDRAILENLALHIAQCGAIDQPRLVHNIEVLGAVDSDRACISHSGRRARQRADGIIGHLQGNGARAIVHTQRLRYGIVGKATLDGQVALLASGFDRRRPAAVIEGVTLSDSDITSSVLLPVIHL